MPVAYGAAYDSAGARIEAESTFGAIPPYACIGCGRPMAAKTIDRPGRLVAKHFAHKAENPACTYESILHADAKKIITESIAAAPEYWLGITCAACGHSLHRRNIAGSKATSEQRIAGNKADVLVRTPEGKPVAIEVVVSHDLEEETRRRYEALGIPVLRARIASQDDLRALRRKVIVAETDYIGRPLPCASCQKRKALAEAEEARTRQEWEDWESFKKSQRAMLGKMKRPTVTCADCGVLFSRPVNDRCPKGFDIISASDCLYGEKAKTQWVQDMKMLGIPRRPQSPWEWAGG